MSENVFEILLYNRKKECVGVCLVDEDDKRVK